MNPNKKLTKSNLFQFSGIYLILPILLNIYYYGFENEFILSLVYIFLFIILGFIDDLVELNVLKKLFILIILSIIYIHNTDIILDLKLDNFRLLHLGKFYGFVFTLFCFLLLLNATNYIDGIDGLLLTISITLCIFFLILLPNNYLFFLITLIVIFFVLLLLNLRIFRILPRLLLGDCGSLGIGFIFCFILIFFTQNEIFLHESVAIWSVAFIVYEFLSINIVRIISNKNIFKKDLNFIFNLLNKKYGLVKTLITCNLINIFFVLIGLFIYVTEFYLTSYLLFIVFFLIYLLFRLRQHSLYTSKS
jgi:UDP-N-acetylmuramyl pentapeptide phosphotransferase/UDP-N-acetylglucosamine-1-phosphate transferase